MEKGIKSVACVGTGMIGAGWATLFALKGLDVVLYDAKQGAAERGLLLIEQNMGFLLEKGIIAEEQKMRALSHLRCAENFTDAVCEADWIQESAFESYEVKRDILSGIDRAAKPGAVYATSSSGLSIKKIAEHSLCPQRCVVVHPYNPVFLIPLVEIVGVEGRSDETVQLAMDFMKSLGKEPVKLNKEAAGFIANRLQIAVQREICHMVYSGIADIENIDKALTFGPGLRWAIMGPTLVTHLGSTDARTMFNTLGKTTNVWLKDMADFKDFPEDWGDVMQAGVDASLKHRPPGIGNDTASLRAYRDDMLLKLLDLHGKLDALRGSAQ